MHAYARAEDRRLTAVVNLLKRLNLGPVVLVLQTGGTVRRGENPRRPALITLLHVCFGHAGPSDGFTADRHA